MTESCENDAAERTTASRYSRRGRTAIGTAIGAIIDAIAGGGKGAAIGPAVGAGAGSVYVQGNEDLALPAGTEVTVRASAPR